MSEREECVFEKAEELAREMNVSVTRVIGKVIDGRAELQIVGGEQRNDGEIKSGGVNYV